MRVVTARYAVFRRRNVNSMLSWHWRNEMRLYGCFRIPTQPIERRHHSIRFGEEEEYEFLYDDDGGILRYDSSLERVAWQHVRHPWEDEDDEPRWMKREFHTIEEKEKYLFGAMLEVKCERSSIMYPPFDCLPIGWTLKNGKVTLW